MPSKILIVDDDPITLSWLKAILEKEGFAVIAVNRAQLALEQIAQANPSLMILDLILPDMDGMELLRQVRQNPNWRDLWVIVLSVKERSEDIVSGLRSGADDYVPKRPGADVELISKIHSLLGHTREGIPEPVPFTPRAAGGTVISFCSAKGGTGTTSVATNAAYALAQLEPHAQVLLADMVFPLGTVGQLIGYLSTETVARLSREVKGKLDRKLVEKYISPAQRWGFRVLLGSSDPKEASLLEVSQIAPLFETLQSMYDYIVIDFGRSLSRVSLPVIQTSDEVVLVLNPDIGTVKLTKATLDYLASLGIARTHVVVVNNHTGGRAFIPKEESESELGVPLAATIPYESECFAMAANVGIPFMAKYPDHAASLMFADLARLLRDRTRK